MTSLTKLWLDAPAEHESIAGWVRVQGWCAIDGLPALPRFDVDERPAHVAVWAEHRPDVSRVNALPENLYYGFSGYVDLGGVDREVMLTARVEVPAGELRWDVPLVSRPAGVVVQVDRPGPYAVAQDVVDVEGWAYGRRTPLVGVRIEGPHGMAVPAAYGRARPAVRRFRHPVAAMPQRAPHPA